MIGAGVIGASLAYRLARAGAAVTLLEAHQVGGGTSGASFAWTNSNGKTPRAYHDLNVAGMRAHTALRDEFDTTRWWHGSGNIEWATDGTRRQALQTKVDRLRSWDYSAERLTPQQLIEMEPAVNSASVADAAIAYYPEEGWVDAVPYAHAMAEAAVRHGARLRTGARVTSLHVSGGRVTEARIADGESFGGDVIVNCAGHWADEVAGLAGARLPLASRAGLLVLTPPVPARPQRILHAPQCSIRSDAGGRLMLHADELDDQLRRDAPPGPSAPVVREVIRRAAHVLPALRSVSAEAACVGMRPIPADGLSAVGPLPSLKGYYAVVTHSGVTLAPFLASAVANELVHGRAEPLLEPFRPSRFDG
ncbi:MAG TPA: FAD-dependent oxidoreductase [bacterium]|nr:FAD-dependent oxidoreductase [bacterium]